MIDHTSIHAWATGCLLNNHSTFTKGYRKVVAIRHYFSITRTTMNKIDTLTCKIKKVGSSNDFLILYCNDWNHLILLTRHQQTCWCLKKNRLHIDQFVLNIFFLIQLCVIKIYTKCFKKNERQIQPKQERRKYIFFGQV